MLQGHQLIRPKPNLFLLRHSMIPSLRLCRARSIEGTTRELISTWQFSVGYTNTDRANLLRWRISGEAVAFISPGVKKLLKRVVTAPSMQKEFPTLPYGHSPRWTTEPRESSLRICCTL